MGGDDLASDDEYLIESGAIQSPGYEARRTSVIPSDSSGNDSDSNGDNDLNRASSSFKKRKASKKKDISQHDQSQTVSSSRKKRKKNVNDNGTTSSTKNILIHAGRGIALDGGDAQAAFLRTCYSHAMKLSGDASVKGFEGHNLEADNGDHGEEKNDGETGEKKRFHPEKFLFQLDHFYSSPEMQSQQISQQQQQHSNLATFFKSGALPSMTPQQAITALAPPLTPR